MKINVLPPGGPQQQIVGPISVGGTIDPAGANFATHYADLGGGGYVSIDDISGNESVGDGHLSHTNSLEAISLERRIRGMMACVNTGTQGDREWYVLTDAHGYTLTAIAGRYSLDQTTWIYSDLAYETAMIASNLNWELVPFGGGGAIDPWADLTPYVINDLRRHNGNQYTCITTHTSNLAGGVNEPGVGTAWETFWFRGNISDSDVIDIGTGIIAGATITTTVPIGNSQATMERNDLLDFYLNGIPNKAEVTWVSPTSFSINLALFEDDTFVVENN